MACRRVMLVNILEVIGTQLPKLKPSNNRSKRLTKKLHRKGAKPLYADRPSVLALPAKLLQRLDQLPTSKRKIPK